jgi:enoyl-CoA hydratase/carnithine racemase
METVEVSRNDRVFTVTMNRPERKNAINGTMWRELTEVFVDLKQQREAWVVVLTGTGENFSSGGDLTSGDSGTREQAMQQITDLVAAIHRLPMPTIAKVRGYCIGGGMGVAMACDLILASDTARFTQNFTLRGMSLDSGSSHSLPRRLSMHRAKELAFLAEFIDGKTAGEIGLVNRVVPDNELDELVAQWAARIASLPPTAVQNNKRLLNNSLGISMEQALEDEATAQYQNWSTADFVEAMRAFRDKRAPKFEGR